MFHILGFLFIIIIAILLIGLSIIGTVIRNIFGLGGRRTSSNSGPYQKGNGNYQPGGYSYNDNRQSSEEAQTEEGEIRPRHKKLFSKDEGEYVDFEEIKDSKFYSISFVFDTNEERIRDYLRLAAKNSFIRAAHSSARIPFTTCVLGCNACEA